MTDRAVYGAIAVITVIVVGLVAALTLTDGSATGALNVAALPLVNACLNSTSAGLLVAGWIMIRRRRFTAHMTCMMAALAVSTLFLASYVTYHYHAGSRPFTGQGWIRPVYFVILLSHIVLAAAIIPFALATVYHGWRALQAFRSAGRGDVGMGVDESGRRSPRSLASPATRRPGTTAHARIARWTLPAWLYVSVTGVLVYWLLHHW